MNVRLLYAGDVVRAQAAGELPYALPEWTTFPDIALKRGDPVFLDLGHEWGGSTCFYVTGFDISIVPDAAELRGARAKVEAELALSMPNPSVFRHTAG